ncbi:hypothetical protein ElyMa_004353600 [Elysia marginata]|uniref:Uncharacterized protein n=1 Tax=Elysia marginata TaxID=1093978 RepID=A0AAV4H6S7_9GAST|nr:hypothetical protein ElyMa_004353600 [Elysia marginata]
MAKFVLTLALLVLVMGLSHQAPSPPPDFDGDFPSLDLGGGNTGKLDPLPPLIFNPFPDSFDDVLLSKRDVETE